MCSFWDHSHCKDQISNYKNLKKPFKHMIFVELADKNHKTMSQCKTKHHLKASVQILHCTALWATASQAFLRKDRTRLHIILATQPFPNLHLNFKVIKFFPYNNFKTKAAKQILFRNTFKK